MVDDINFIFSNEVILQNKLNAVFFYLLLSCFIHILKTIIACITIFWFIAVFIAILESSKIVNYDPKTKKICALFLYPTPLFKVHDKYPTITLVYDLYCNFIFDITYIRIKYKGSSYEFFRLIILSYFGLSKFFFKFIKMTFFTTEYKDISDLILIYYSTASDNRNLFFRDNKWTANPDAIKIINKILESPDYPSKEKEVWRTSVLQNEHTYNILNSKKYNPTSQLHEHKSLKQRHHWIFHTMHNLETGNIAYQTNLASVVQNKFFDKSLLELSTESLEKINKINPNIKITKGFIKSQETLIDLRLIAGDRYLPSLFSKEYKSQVIDLRLDLNNFLANIEDVNLAKKQK